jgi:hypothetical protein
MQWSMMAWHGGGPMQDVSTSLVAVVVPQVGNIIQHKQIFWDCNTFLHTFQRWLHAGVSGVW